MIAPASGGSNWIGELPQDREDLLAFVQRLQGERRVETGPGRIWDYEAMGIALGRDKQAEAQVVRRYFENDIIVEAAAVPSTPAIRSAIDADPGVALVRGKARQTYTEARSRMQASLGTLERVAEALADARGRKTLLFLSEGFIMDPTLPNFRTLLQAARNANVAIHFVDVGNPGGPIGQAGLAGSNAETARAVEDRDATLGLALVQREAEGARSIAADTGGRTVSGSNLLDGLRRIASEGRAYYLLGYSPIDSRRNGRFRKIEVAVRNRPDVTVRARGGYFEPASDREAPPPDPDRLDPEVRAALDSPFGAPGIPLRLTSYVFGVQSEGKLRTLLVAEADTTALRLQVKNGRSVTTLDSYVLVHDRNRDSIERDERRVDLDVPAEAMAQLQRTGIPVQREFLLEPGSYQATLLLRDRTTGAIGSVRHEFEVAAPGQFRMSTPIVTDTVQPPAAAGQPPRPVAIARRTFPAGARIAVAFDVYGWTERAGGPQVSVAYALRRADGTQVAGAAPQALKANALGQLPVTIGLSLPPDAIGDHELRLSVRDEQALRVIEHVEPLVIAPPRP
jgi:VWFA-related protein